MDRSKYSSFQFVLKIGWDNAPHHTQISTHPHHKHIASQSNIQPSEETSLEDVIDVIEVTIG